MTRILYRDRMVKSVPHRDLEEQLWIQTLMADAVLCLKVHLGLRGPQTWKRPDSIEGELGETTTSL